MKTHKTQSPKNKKRQKNTGPHNSHNELIKSQAVNKTSLNSRFLGWGAKLA